jgi:hypothetical protein
VEGVGAEVVSPSARAGVIVSSTYIVIKPRTK